MNWKSVGYFILGTFVIWIGYDLWLNSHGGPTESQWLLTTARSWTIIPYVLGFLCGHWFFPRRTKAVTYGWGWAIGMFAGVIGTDLLWQHFFPGQASWLRYPGLWLLMGIPTGMYLWNQTENESPIP